MKVDIHSIERYDLVTSYEFEVDEFELIGQNVVRFLRDVKKKHHLTGKAFVVSFPTMVYYVYRINKNDYRIYKVS